MKPPERCGQNGKVAGVVKHVYQQRLQLRRPQTFANGCMPTLQLGRPVLMWVRGSRSRPPSVLAHLDVHQCWVEANFAPPAAAAPRKPKNLLMDTVPHCSIPDMPAPVPAALEPSRFPHKILSASPVSAAPTMSAVPPPVSTRRRAGLLRRHWAGASAVVHRITCRWALVWVFLVRDDTGGLSVSRRLVCLCSQRLFNAAGHGVQRWPTMRHQ